MILFINRKKAYVEESNISIVVSFFFFFDIYNRKIRSSLNNINFQPKETLNKVHFEIKNVYFKYYV